MARTALLLALALFCTPPARAQDNPVFVDDSTLAADVLAGLPGLLVSGNTGEAVHLLQRLLEEEGDRLLATADDADRFEPVRARVHRVLLAEPVLLERYRTVQTDEASRLLGEGRAEAVERSRLLTAPGFDAAVRVASGHLASGRFEAARLTLGQLAIHPDRDDPARAAAAAGLWAELSGYLPRERVREQARAWAERAGVVVEAAGEVEWPASLLAESYSPLYGAPGFALGELLDTPLCSADLREGVGEEEPEPPSRRGRSSVELPFLFPLVSGDTVYATDGLWVGAWDRFTLTPRWRTKPRGADNEREILEELYAANAYRRNKSRDVEEATVLSLHGRLLLTATGLVADGGRQGDPRLHALDARTGRVLWSSYIDELDPQLDESTSRGPAVFEGDTAVVAVRKISQTRRFASAYLVGIDLADGSARWVRLAGSAGWLSFVGRGRWTDWPLMHQGVVYRVDELGVICAVEAGSGRFRWVVRMPGVESRMPSPRLPWAASSVVIDGDTMLALSPDRRHLVRLELATGRVVGRREMQPLGLPGYLFGHRGSLIAVSPYGVVSVPIAQAETAPARVSMLLEEPGLVGRVVASGDTLLAPVAGGVRVLDADTLEQTGAVALQAPGNLVPLGTQMIAADNQRVHGYLEWDAASTLLQARLDADPMDLGAAISYAELAHRAGRPGEMLAPIDAAIEAMAADPLGAEVGPGRSRLFELLRAAVRDELEHPEVGLSPATLGGMTARMALVASGGAERAAQLLLRSRVHERLGRAGEAVADCQAVLADPALAGAEWGRDSSSVRAELDALRRLDRLLAEHGRAVYAPFEQEAAARLAALSGDTPEPFEALARAYPRSGAALRACLASAERRGEAGEVLALDRVLDRGARMAAAMREVGLSPEPGVVGELLGRRLTALVAANRLDTASELMASSAQAWSGVTMTSDGEPLDLAALGETLRARAEARSRRPVIGDGLSGTPVVVDGWVLMRALDRRDAFAARAGVMMLGAGRVGLWSIDRATGRPAPVWTAPTATKAALVRFDPDRVLLFEPDERGGAFVALDPADGRELWRVGQIGEALALATGPAPVTGRERFESPLDGEVGATDTLLALDEATLAVASRSGRVVGIDLAAGRVAWTVRTDCPEVADVAAGEGVLVVGGVGSPRTGDVAGEPTVLVLDLATGEEISRHTPVGLAAGGRVRWVRVARGSSRAVVGLSRGLVSLSLPDAQPAWTLADLAVQQTDAAWAVGSRLFVQSSLRELTMIDAPTGEVLGARLPTAETLDAGEPTDAVIDAGRLTLLSPAGWAALDARTGELLAADAVGSLSGRVAQPCAAAGRVVLAEREPVAGSPGVYRVHVLDGRTGRTLSTTALALTDRPRRVGVLDGAVFITAGDTTVVAPAE